SHSPGCRQLNGTFTRAGCALPARRPGLRQRRQGGAGTGPARTGGEPRTGWTYIKDLGKHVGTAGESCVLTSHSTQEFTYNSGQSSSTGVGWSNSRKTRAFTISGTFSWSGSLPETWPAFGANRSVWYQTQFKFGEFSCFIPAAAHTFYVDRVNGFAGGATIKAPALDLRFWRTTARAPRSSSGPASTATSTSSSSMPWWSRSKSA